VLADTEFIANQTDGEGGGAYMGSSAALTGTSFTNNSASQSGGGALFNNTVAITGSDFTGNSASQGGGIFLHQSLSLSRIVNSVFARNSAGDGDAMYLHDPSGAGGAVDVVFTTVASPTLSTGTAIVAGAGSASITNTIIASHTVGISQTGAATVNSDYNLFSGNSADVAGAVVTGSSSIVGDPAFVDAANDNLRLTVNSFALDRGIDLGIATDYDGNPRPFGPQFDIGAFELQASNQSPVADAGTPQTVFVNAVATLNGSASSDPENQPLTFGWTQLGGTLVMLSDSSAVMPTFTAPAITSTLVFQLVVTDSLGLASMPALVTITVELTPVTTLPPDGAAITLTTGIALLQPSKDFTATLGSGDEPITYTWDFGDGSPLFYGPVASHVYAPGTYTATLTATNSAGTVTTTLRIFVPWRVLLSIMVKESGLPLLQQHR
jgi:PKD repeat protein